MPPTKPTLPVFDVSFAITPTRNEPSSALNTIDCTFGLSTTMSMMPNLVSGNSSATLPSAVAQANPGMMIGLKPSLANLRRTCSRWASFWISRSRKGTLNSFAELGRAVEHALVEGFVELAAEIIDDGRLDLGGVSRGGGEEAARANGGGQETVQRERTFQPSGLRREPKAAQRPKNSTKLTSWSA